MKRKLPNNDNDIREMHKIFDQLKQHHTSNAIKGLPASEANVCTMKKITAKNN